MARKTTATVEVTPPRKARPGEKIIDTVEIGMMLSDEPKFARQRAIYHLNKPGHLVEVLPPCEGCEKRFVTLESALALQEQLRERRERRDQKRKEKRESEDPESRFDPEEPAAEADDEDAAEWEAEEDVDELAAFAESEEE